jgi:hypothetical protein
VTKPRLWNVRLLAPLHVAYGMEGRTRTAEPADNYTMREYRSEQGDYRISAPEKGFFDRTRLEINALIDSGTLIVDGDWPP